MELTVDVIDQVVFYKGRVWTIYGVGNGVHAYNGLKPYDSFKFDHRTNYHRFNTTYIPTDEIQVIEGEEIEKCVKLEKAAEKRKLNKKYATEFFSWLTGHTKTFVSKNLIERFNGFAFLPGRISYEIWKMDGVLYLSHNTDNGYSNLSYLDFVTWEWDDRLYEKDKDAYIEQILEDHK